MMEIEAHLKILADRFKNNYSIVTYAETLEWPDGRFGELIEMSALSPYDDAIIVKCPGCDKGCFVEPEVDILDDGKSYAHKSCRKEGRDVPIDEVHFKQWQINIEALTEMGYVTDSDDDLISLTDAGKIMGMHSGNIARLVDNGKIKDNGLTRKKRKVYKSSVLLEKNRRDRKGYEVVVDDLQADTGNIQEDGY